MAKVTDEERKKSLEKVVAIKLLKLAMETDKKERKTEEDGSYHTTEVSPGDRRSKKS